MKYITFFITIILNVSISAALGGGDAGGGPSTDPSLFSKEFKVDSKAHSFNFRDMKYRNKKVKVVVGYKIEEEVCREFSKGGNENEICHFKDVLKSQEVSIGPKLFPNDLVKTLKKRKLFSRKERYRNLAQDHLLIQVHELDKKKVVELEIR